ncbi:remorin 4.1-like isoform X2 [Miscanthus floridulus]|uniref:remorin 4.1-like isoform X2 n=1 Tax=Miscanthus floridulus TaxID=154761 RepID=UPI0034589319
MLSEQTAASTSSSGGGVEHQERSVEDDRRLQPVGENEEEEEEFRDIHALSPPPTPSQPSSYRLRASWGSAAGGSRHTSIRSVGSDTAPSEPFPTMSREFSAMVAAAASANAAANANAHGDAADRDVVDAMGWSRIGEAEEELEETNPLAIVPDSNPIPSPRRGPPTPGGADVALMAANGHGHANGEGGVSVGQVKKEEVESKIAAWQIAEVAKVNNRFKREEVVINGWEGDQVEKASAWLKKYERKLEEKRAKAMEKAQNEVAKARRKAEEKRASAEAKRGTKVARVLELAKFMRAVGRAPSTKRSFF